MVKKHFILPGFAKPFPLVLIGYPDRAPLKEVLGGQYNYREGGGKCCGKALKAAGGVEVVDVIRIRAPKK